VDRSKAPPRKIPPHTRPGEMRTGFAHTTDAVGGRCPSATVIPRDHPESDMRMDGVSFAAIDWSEIPAEQNPGESGTARSRTFSTHEYRVRLVEYSPGYVADHWCRKGHIVLCVRGEFLSHHEDGSVHKIRQGMSYVVGDSDVPHRSSTEGGATLFIVD